jgi:hypothetical protein
MMRNQETLDRALAALGCFACLFAGGCDAGNAAKTDAKRHMLTIYGYNYTDQYIDEFTVDGQGGGNVFVSTPTAGGGKGSCCVNWVDGTPLPQTVTVRWAYATCKTRLTDSYGDTKDWFKPLFKEEQVQLTVPIPSNPGYFEVHIYPDQHVEVAVTQTWSEPRLKLDPVREIKTYPPCPANIT